MKRKPLYCIIILFIISLTIVVNTGSANAYTFFSNFNITKFSYKVDSTSGTVQTVNSINNNASTPYIIDSFTGNYHAIISPKFTLNKAGTFSKTKRMLLQFEVMTKYSKADGTSNVNTYFTCPMGEGYLRVARCVIHNSDYEVIGEHTDLNTPNPDTNMSYALVSDKSYIIELELYYQSDTDVSLSELQLAGRIFAVSVNPNASPLPTGFNWQISWIQSSAFLYEDPNAAASAINEQNRKDDQDRSNMNNQQGDIDDSADESTEDMDNATSNITGIVSTFLGNLNNLNRNNCTLPNISAYGFSLGELNLCTFQPPQWVRTVTSAVVSLIVLSMAVHVFRRIMRIAKGIAGSK